MGSSLLSLTLSCHAAAQQAGAEQPPEYDRGVNVSVLQRPRPGYEAIGVTLGSMRLYPRATVEMDYDDNIFATATAPESDEIIQINPSLELDSQWARHSLKIAADLSQSLYLHHTGEDTLQGGVDANGVLDIANGFEADAQAGWRRITQPRNVAGGDLTSQPVQYSQGTLIGTLKREVGRFKIQGDATYIDYRYDEAPLSGGGMDNWSHYDLLFGVRGEYAFGPSAAGFVSFSHNQHDYDLQPPFTVIDRNSQGWTVTAGANFDITRLIRGEVGVGYLQQSFRAPASPGASGLALHSQVEYFATALMTFTFIGNRSVRVAQVPDSPAYIDSDVSARLDYELLRNLLLNATTGYEDDAYRLVDRNDIRWQVGLGATYLVSRSFGVRCSVNHLAQTSSGAAAGPNFTENRVMLTFTGQL